MPSSKRSQAKSQVAEVSQHSSKAPSVHAASVQGEQKAYLPPASQHSQQVPSQKPDSIRSQVQPPSVHSQLPPSVRSEVAKESINERVTASHRSSQFQTRKQVVQEPSSQHSTKLSSVQSQSNRAIRTGGF